MEFGDICQSDISTVVMPDWLCCSFSSTLITLSVCYFVVMTDCILAQLFSYCAVIYTVLILVDIK